MAAVAVVTTVPCKLAVATVVAAAPLAVELVVAAVTVAVLLAVCAWVAMAAAVTTNLLRTLLLKQSRQVFKESFLSLKRELWTNEPMYDYCIKKWDKMVLAISY